MRPYDKPERRVRSVHDQGIGLYIVEAVGMDVVKIGRATDPRKRLRDLQCGSPAELRLLRFWLNAGDSERRVHELLAEHRSHGEWFHRQGLVASLIAARDEIPEGIKGKDFIPALKKLEPMFGPPPRPLPHAADSRAFMALSAVEEQLAEVGYWVDWLGGEPTLRPL